MTDTSDNTEVSNETADQSTDSQWSDQGSADQSSKQTASQTSSDMKEASTGEKIMISLFAIIILVVIVVGGCYEFADWKRWHINHEPPIHKWTNTYRRWHKLEQIKVLAKNGLLDEHDLADLERERHHH